MERSTIGRVLRRATEDEDFRKRSIENLGMALAQDGFILTDAEMRQVRAWWEEIQGMGARGGSERIQALARAHRP